MSNLCGIFAGIRTDKLVVRRVVGDSNDTGLLADTLRTPGEVAGLETESTELAVATTSADSVDTYEFVSVDSPVGNGRP